MALDLEGAQVKAAGGVVWQAAPEGPQVAVIHRPQYDDWSLPKGKLDPGESWEEAAAREVLEEIGLRCALGAELEPVAYDDRKGRAKVVRYWLMEAVAGSSAFEPNDEVDVLRWMSPADAVELLTYPRDAELVRAAAAELGAGGASSGDGVLTGRSGTAAPAASASASASAAGLNRERFPALADGWARLDGPAGSQVVDSAIEAMAGWMRGPGNANHGGAFAAAHATDALVAATREKVGRLLNADPATVAFGPSMTALTMRFAATVGREWAPGDEIVCTRLDHDANVRPWVIAAERAGATVRWAEPEPGTLELPAAAVTAVLSERTRWVAVTAASNAVGTVPDLPGIVAAAHAVGARVYLDAVHATPHGGIDVAALDCDALSCSAYKWFGPHVGILCGKRELLEGLRPDKLAPSPEENPDRWELGTLPFESLAGVAAAADYMASLDWPTVRAHEDALLRAAFDGLEAIPGVTVHGRAPDRAPTLMFTLAGHTPEAVASALAARQVAVWHGNYYAWELERHLGLAPAGAVRAGFLHYNGTDDVERLLAGVRSVA